jgi:hypothetical protein
MEVACLNKVVVAFDRKHNLDCQQVKFIAKYLYTVKRSLESMFFNLKLLGTDYYFPKIHEAKSGTQANKQSARFYSAHYFSVILQFIDSINFLHHGQMISAESVFYGQKHIHPSTCFRFDDISHIPEDNKIRLSMMCLDYYYIKLADTRKIYDDDYVKTMKNIRLDQDYQSKVKTKLLFSLLSCLTLV